MKKSKILLTLVVLVLVCSMLFALVACNDKKDEPKTDNTTQEQGGGNNDSDKEPEQKPEEPEVPEIDYTPIHTAFAEAINNTFAFTMTDEQKVGFDYAISVPVADTAEGESRVIDIKLKGKLNATTVNENVLQLAVGEKIGSAALANIFVVTANDDALYVDTKTADYKFPELGLGKMLSGVKFDPSQVGGIIEMITGVAGGMVFGEATEVVNEDGTIDYSVDVDLEKLGEVLPMLGGMIQAKVPFLENFSATMDGLFADITDLLALLDINVKANVKVNKVTDEDGEEYDFPVVQMFKIDVIVDSKDEAHITFDPTNVGVDVAPTFAAVPTKVVETGLLNFNIAGGVKVGPTTYNFDVKADLDVFTVVNNLIQNEKDRAAAQAAENEAAKAEKREAKIIPLQLDNMFAGSKSKFLVTLTNNEGADPIYVVMDQAKFGDVIYFAEKNDKTGKYSLLEIDPAVLIAGQIAKDAAADKAAAEEAKKPLGPVLTVAEPNNAEYAAMMNAYRKDPKNGKPVGTISWAVKDGATYEVTVNGEPAEPVVDTAKKVASVKAASGVEVSVVEVTTVKETVEGKEVVKTVKSQASTDSYIDGRATARAVAKAVSMLTAIDFDYATYSVTLDAFYVKEFLLALDLAINDGTGNVAGIGETIDQLGVMSVNVASAGFWNPENRTADLGQEFMTGVGFATVEEVKAAVTAKLTIDGVKPIA